MQKNSQTHLPPPSPLPPSPGVFPSLLFCFIHISSPAAPPHPNPLQLSLLPSAGKRRKEGARRCSPGDAPLLILQRDYRKKEKKKNQKPKRIQKENHQTSSNKHGAAPARRVNGIAPDPIRRPALLESNSTTCFAHPPTVGRLWFQA